MKKITRKNALINALQTNDTVTGNGAVSHSTTGSSLVDLFGKGGSMRSQPESASVDLFRAAYNEDKTLALKILFYLGDVRQGQGERKLFRTCYNWLASQDATVAGKLLAQIPEFTRYDNVLESLENTALEKDALTFMAKQLTKDLRALLSKKEDAKLSLCAKWAPSEQASSKITKRLASKLRKAMRMSSKDYRRMLSALRKEIDIVERKMCEGDWTKINYQAVPSRASTIYRKAFAKHDMAGYSKFMTKVEKGEATINASVLYPYDLVRNYIHSYGELDRTLEAQWKALPDYLKDNPHNGFVVADTSGSMDCSGHYGGKTSNVPPIDVAVSLAIYFAERVEGAFKNTFMMFADEPVLETLKGDSLKAKVASALGSRPCGNTNFQAIFDLILEKGVKHKVPQTEMPAVIYIVSDMQFDQAVTDNSCTNFEAVQKKYKAAGYKLPRIVFWNVNSYADVPIKVDDKGVCLVSGCSPSILKSVMSNKVLTPYDAMLSAVNVERYAPIHA
jgi:hypothetical protein